MWKQRCDLLVEFLYADLSAGVLGREIAEMTKAATQIALAR